MSNLVRLGVEYFPDDDKGKPVGGGSIYVGLTDTDPEVVGNQKQIEALQEDGSFVNMTQPVTLSAGGVPLYNGSPVSLYVKGDYSLKVLDAQGGQVYYIPSYYYVEEGPLTPGNYYYPNSTAADHGVVGDSDTIKYYVDLIGSDKATLYFRHDSDSQWTDYELLTSETIPSNIKLEFENGTRINIDSGVIFTINGTIETELSQIFTGSGTVVGDLICDGVYPHWWYSGDWGAAIQAAQDFCGSSTIRQVTLLPSQDYDVGTTTIEYKAPIIGQSATAENSPVLLTSISDGSAVIRINNIDFYHLRDFKIAPLIVDTFTNAIGIQTLNTCNRFFIDNIYVRYLTKGFELDGFIGNITNAWAKFCTTGMEVTTFNSVDLHFNAEDCTTGLIIDGSGGSKVFALIENCTTGAILDDVSSIVATFYMEGNTKNLSIGETSLCSSVTLNGGHYITGTADIIIDQVMGLSFVGSPLIRCPVTITANAKDVDLQQTPERTLYTSDYIFFLTQDNAKQVTPFYNYFSNPNFVGGVRGTWSRVTKAGITTSIETSQATTRLGGSALKIIHPASQGFGNLTFRYENEVLDLLKGRSALAGAWVYIPDIPGYSSEGDDLIADIVLATDLGATGSHTVYWRVGGWNFFACRYDVESTAAYLDLQFYTNRSGNTVGTEAYIYISDIILTEGDDYGRMYRKQWIPHALAGRWDASAYIGYGTLPPSSLSTAANFEFQVGDKWMNTAISVDGNNMVLDHWVCTVAGSAGTWTPQYYSTVTPAT